MYIDDIKLFAKNQKELETLIQAVRIYSQDTRMKFGREKCAMLIMKKGKHQMMEGTELPNQEKKSLYLFFTSLSLCLTVSEWFLRLDLSQIICFSHLSLCLTVSEWFLRLDLSQIICFSHLSLCLTICLNLKYCKFHIFFLFSVTNCFPLVHKE